MRRSQWPQADLHEVYLSGSGTLSQVLEPTIVAEALARENEASDGEDNPISGLKNALLLSTVFWVLLFGVIRFVL